MNRNWIYLVAFAVVLMIAVIGWDVFATFAGFKNEFSFSISPIENRLYGPVEQHLRDDPDFVQFEIIADQNS